MFILNRICNIILPKTCIINSEYRVNVHFRKFNWQFDTNYWSVMTELIQIAQANKLDVFDIFSYIFINYNSVRREIHDISIPNFSKLWNFEVANLFSFTLILNIYFVIFPEYSAIPQFDWFSYFFLLSEFKQHSIVIIFLDKFVFQL